MKKKKDALQLFLDKGHRPFCQIRYFGNPHCTCGLDEAIARYKEIKSLIREKESTVFL